MEEGKKKGRICNYTMLQKAPSRSSPDENSPRTGISEQNNPPQRVSQTFFSGTELR